MSWVWPGAAYRMYYTGFAPEVYEQSDLLGHILSASSPDGSSWAHDDGVRINVHGPHASQRTLCPDVVPIPGGGYRMYYEARTAGRSHGDSECDVGRRAGLGVGRGGQNWRRCVVVRVATLRVLPDRSGAGLPALLSPLLVSDGVGSRRAESHRERGVPGRSELRDGAGRAYCAGD